MLIYKASKERVLLNQVWETCKNTVRIIPPLTVTENQLDRLIEVLRKIFKGI